MINLVVALHPEAKPIIEHYQLKLQTESAGWRIYRNGSITLIITGIGKVAAAAATTYLHCLQGEVPNQAWLNIGIAGTQKAELGESFLAHKIMDHATKQSWYPQLLFTPPCPTQELYTVAQPELTYPEAVLYEMEAAGFYQVANRFASAELIHVYKIISDTQQSSTEHINKNFVAQIVRKKLPEIAVIVEEQIQLAQELAQWQISVEQALNHFRQIWHFSTTEQRQLGKLLRRWQVLLPEKSILEQDFSACHSGKELLAALQKKLDTVVPW